MMKHSGLAILFYTIFSDDINSNHLSILGQLVDHKNYK